MTQYPNIPVCQFPPRSGLSRRCGILGAIFLILCCTFVSAEDRNNWQQPDRVIGDLGLKPGTTVADIGSGEGYFTLQLAGAVGRQGRVLAVDVDTDALAALKKQADQQRLTNVTTIVSEPTNTRLPNESVDVLFICDVLHEVPEAQRLPLVQSAVQALKPGGFLYLIDWRKSRDVKFDPYEKLVPRDELVRLCTDTGLRLDAEYHYLKYQVFLRFQKPVK
jgi:ubiquinone/menaquinone biosynthesis C-methylase UbiE